MTTGSAAPDATGATARSASLAPKRPDGHHGPAVSGPSPLAELLGALAGRIGERSIDELWVFPPRATGKGASSLVVVSAFEESGARRRLITARSRPGSAPEVVEHGVAPPDRIIRLLQGVVRRLDGGEEESSPAVHFVGGDAARWETAVERVLGPVAPEEPERE